MRCVMCGAETVPAPPATRDLDFGLPGLRIEGLPAHSCPECGEEYVDLPNAETLLGDITWAICAQEGRLVGAEIRFLRKRLGWSGRDFAAQFMVDPTTVSKWENDKQRIEPFKEKMLKLLALHGRLLDDYGHDLDPDRPERPYRVFVPDFGPSQGKGAAAPRATSRKRAVGRE